MAINHLQGYAFAKKKGDTIHVFEDPHALSDFLPVIAEGSDVPRMLKDRFADTVNVKDFGAKGDGTTDDTEAIRAAIEAAEARTVWFPDGIYLVSSEIQTTCEDEKLPFICLDRKAVLKAAENFTGDYVVHIGAFGVGASSYSAQRHRPGFFGGLIDGNGVANGLFSENTHCAHIYGFDVINAKQIGVKIGPAYGTATSGDAYVQNVNVLCANSGDPDSVGFWIDSYDCDVRDIRAGSFCTGVRMLKGGYCANAHPIYGNMGDVYNSSVGFEINGGTHLTDCYSDNFSTAIHQNGNSSWFASGFTAYWYTNTNHNHTIIKVSGTDQFQGTINGMSITMPSNGVNRGIWMAEGNGLNIYNNTLPNQSQIRGLKMSESDWYRMTYRHTDHLFDNWIRNEFTYSSGDVNSSASTFKTGFWYPLCILKSDSNISEISVSFNNVLIVDLSFSVAADGLSFLRSQAWRNAAGSVMELQAGKVFDDYDRTYYVVYFRFVSHEKKFSPTDLTVQIKPHSYRTRFILPICSAHNYDDFYKGLTSIENTVGSIERLDLGVGAQEDHRPQSRYYTYATSHSIPIIDSNYFQRLFVHFGTTDQCYLIRGSTVRLLYSSDKPDPTPVTIQISGSTESGYSAEAVYQSYSNPVTWQVNSDNSTIDFTFPSSATVHIETY